MKEIRIEKYCGNCGNLLMSRHFKPEGMIDITTDNCPFCEVKK